MKRNARRRPLSQLIDQDLSYMKTALKTTPLIMATTLTTLRLPEHRTPLSASSFARIGMEEDAISGPLTSCLGGATSRAAWMVKSIPYLIMGKCLKTTMTIMHLVPGIALLWYVENVQIIPNTSEIAAKTQDHGMGTHYSSWSSITSLKSLRLRKLLD